ncbi:MAG: tetratricopeptide repeat protein [Alphaproteobacteria bacterium]|nr:tetratricopeptide repeat protein [Alphaproteobacteria bacterium]
MLKHPAEEIAMRGVLFAAALLISPPCLAMGGGGGGMGMGGGGYGSGMRGSAGFDDYGTAVRLIKHEKYSDAIPYLNRALQQRPNNADVLNYLGYTHRMLGDYPGSLDFYQRALARDPDHKGAHEYLGELYLKMNRLADAQGELAQLTRLCVDGCEERDVLTKAIADYQLAAAAPATPAAQPAAPAQTAAPAGGTP